MNELPFTESAKKRRFVSNSVRTVGLVYETAPYLVISLGIAALFQALTPLMVALVSKQIIDSVVEIHAKGATTARYFSALRWVALECGIVVIQSLTRDWNNYVKPLLRSRVGLSLSTRIMTKACSLTFSHFQNPAFVNQLARAREQCQQRPIEMMFQLVELFQSCVALVSYTIVISTFAPWMIVLLIASVLPPFWVEVKKGTATFELAHDQAERNRKGWYLEWVLTTEGPAREVKALAIGPWLIKKYKDLQQVFITKEARQLRKFFFGTGSLGLLRTLVVYAVYGYVVREAMFGRITLGTMTLYLSVFQQALYALGSSMISLASLYEGNLFMSNLFEYLALPEDDVGSAIDPSDTIDHAPSIEFQKVRFAYSGSGPDVLRDFDLAIRPGEAMALVGLNGAGKTSIVKLLAGLYDPLEGKILIDQTDASTKRRGWRRQNIGVLFQDYLRFDFSAVENIALGWVPEIDNRSRVEQAVKSAGADKLISRLSGGLDTALGPAFGGIDLSGGQWQNLVLARLLMRRSPVLVLDEPTAALDASAEDEMFARFAEWKKDRTVILVTHRFSTLKLVDRIAVIEEGHVVEIGTHEELMSLGKRYFALFNLQRSGYDFKKEPTSPALTATSAVDVGTVRG